MDEEAINLLGGRRIPPVPLPITFCTSIIGFCVSIACIAIGSIYQDEKNCPASPQLANILITLGILAIASSTYDIWNKAREEGDNENPCCKCSVTLLRLVHFGFFIWLCVAAFGLAAHVKYDPYPVVPGQANYYCNATLFLFAYWFILATVIILGVFFFCFCCALVCLSLAA